MDTSLYINQFILKYKVESKKFYEKAFMIIEQIPGYTETADVTNFLQKGYWPSFNIPYIKTIYEKMGFVEMIEEKPSLYDKYDYSGSDRPIIFRKYHSNINSLEDYKKMLRYNNYE